MSLMGTFPANKAGPGQMCLPDSVMKDKAQTRSSQQGNHAGRRHLQHLPLYRKAGACHLLGQNACCQDTARQGTRGFLTTADSQLRPETQNSPYAGCQGKGRRETDATGRADKPPQPTEDGDATGSVAKVPKGPPTAQPPLTAHPTYTRAVGQAVTYASAVGASKTRFHTSREGKWPLGGKWGKSKLSKTQVEPLSFQFS